MQDHKFGNELEHREEWAGTDQSCSPATAMSPLPTDSEVLASLRVAYQERLDMIWSLVEENEALRDENRTLRETTNHPCIIPAKQEVENERTIVAGM